MQRFVSVLLPVQDAQATLADSVHEILETVSDLGSPFEVLIIDDGSSDATSEVAHDLARHYPQVRMIRHGTPLGRDAAIHSGLARSRGETVVLRDESRGLRLVERAHPQGGPARSHPGVPNYLRRLKDLILSE